MCSLCMAVVCVCTSCVCLLVSLSSHTQAFLTQEDLDMSLSVSTKILEYSYHVALYASAALMCGGITLEAGWWFVYRDAVNSKCQREVLASHLSVSVNLATVT